jgi:hypothetical protein
MLRVSCFLLSLFILLDTSDCDPEKQAARITSLEAEVKELKTEVAALKQKPAAPDHHYELRNDGLRTFRFDPATGGTCIQLTSPTDWKKKETQAESCACSDARQTWLDLPTNNDQQQKYAEYYHTLVQQACGESPTE